MFEGMIPATGYVADLTDEDGALVTKRVVAWTRFGEPMVVIRTNIDLAREWYTIVEIREG